MTMSPVRPMPPTMVAMIIIPPALVAPSVIPVAATVPTTVMIVVSQGETDHPGCYRGKSCAFWRDNLHGPSLSIIHRRAAGKPSQQEGENSCQKKESSFHDTHWTGPPRRVFTINSPGVRSAGGEIPACSPLIGPGGLPYRPTGTVQKSTRGLSHH